jgi:sulfhydrogenase subunit beta (sulfur reductase)
MRFSRYQPGSRKRDGMIQLVIGKESVPDFLGALTTEYRVVSPREVAPGDTVFDDFDARVGIAYGFVNTLMPPKALFFPRRETLLQIDLTDGLSVAPPPEERPLAVFGMRSCDATGLLVLERFFGRRGFDDATVTGRIASSLRMTMACVRPGPDCFCVCCDGGPFLLSGFDLQFVDLGDHLLVEVGTPKGAEVVEANDSLFVAATEPELHAKEAAVAASDSVFQRRSYISQGIKNISLGKVPEETWEAWAKDCQGCGGCCYICPTCSCFSVDDVADGADGYRRERSWDTCIYEGFTREASGHNPRAAAGRRLQRRFFHKMSYQYVELMGRHGCVGCGRCVTACMGELDISTLLERIHDGRR